MGFEREGVRGIGGEGIAIVVGRRNKGKGGEERKKKGKEIGDTGVLEGRTPTPPNKNPAYGRAGV
jgi:hypothetical protein